jgi:hypothetical protein
MNLSAKNWSKTSNLRLHQTFHKSSLAHQKDAIDRDALSMSQQAIEII